MGSFYTQVLVRNADEHRCAEVMRTLRRSSYVIPPQNNVSVVCDKESEDQNIDTLDSLAFTLSSKLSTSAVAVLNHDDDWLIFRLFNDGKFVGGVQVGHTPLSLRGPISKLRNLLNPRATLLPLYVALLRPRIFQLQRHADIVDLLGLPQRSVGVGYKYISTDNSMKRFDKAGIVET